MCTQPRLYGRPRGKPASPDTGGTCDLPGAASAHQRSLWGRDGPNYVDELRVFATHRRELRHGHKDKRPDQTEHFCAGVEWRSPRQDEVSAGRAGTGVGRK
jgi:hypothetical protein